MTHFGKRVQITTKGGQTVTGRFVDYYNLHLCLDTGSEVRWVALIRIKKMEPVEMVTAVDPVEAAAICSVVGP